MQATIAKTTGIVFHKANARNVLSPSELPGIDRVLCAKLLGVWLQADMGLRKHVDYILHICNQRTYLLTLGLLKYPNDFSKAQALNQLWYKDTETTAAKVDNNEFAARHAYLIQSPTVKGTFSFRIP